MHATTSEFSGRAQKKCALSGKKGDKTHKEWQINLTNALKCGIILVSVKRKGEGKPAKVTPPLFPKLF